METPYLCPGEGHSNGGRKSMKTSGINFCYKNWSVRPFELVDILINISHSFSQFRSLKITEWVIFVKYMWHILSAILMSCGVITPNFKIPYYKSEGWYRTENLQKEMYLGCSMTKESWKLRDTAILHFRIYMASRENKEFSLQLLGHAVTSEGNTFQHHFSLQKRLTIHRFWICRYRLHWGIWKQTDTFYVMRFFEMIWTRLHVYDPRWPVHWLINPGGGGGLP